MANQFGERIKQLRESNSLLQRQVAVYVGIDSPMLSKIEKGDRKAKREQISALANILESSRDELFTLWLADQVLEIVKDEVFALEAMHLAEIEVKMLTGKTL